MWCLWWDQKTTKSKTKEICESGERSWEEALGPESLRRYWAGSQKWHLWSSQIQQEAAAGLEVHSGCLGWIVGEQRWFWEDPFRVPCWRVLDLRGTWDEEKEMELRSLKMIWWELWRLKEWKGLCLALNVNMMQSRMWEGFSKRDCLDSTCQGGCLWGII